ncbi:hypothetical protein FEM08_08090 [Flavobacterium gilvum]|nr:hypothetical protein FEM08_08090 [Flavobacterium gilvum]
MDDYLSISITSILTFVLILLFAKRDKLTLSDIGLKIKSTHFPRFLSGFGLGFILVLIQALIASNFAEIKFNLSGNISVLSIISSLGLYFVIALREELVFRSYAMRNLANSINPVFALVFITIIFILEHVISGMSWKMSIIGSGLGGILFGLSALKTKGIALPLGIHFAWNFTQCLLGFKSNSGIWKEVVEKGHEAHAENVALIGFVIAMTIGISFILLFYKKEKI